MGGCDAWGAVSGNACDAGKVIKKDEGCDGASLSGCSDDKCCKEPEACSHALGLGGDQCSSFDSKCNAEWMIAKTECTEGGMTKCDPNYCKDDTRDPVKCKAELELCRKCTPTAAASKCQDCIKCYSHNVFRIKPDGAECKDDDAGIKAMSKGAIATCAAGKAYTHVEKKGEKKSDRRLGVMNMCLKADRKTINMADVYFDYF